MTPNCTRNNIISSKNAHSDNSAVSLNIAFDEESPLRGQGFWKFNNSLSLDTYYVEILTFKFSKFVTQQLVKRIQKQGKGKRPILQDHTAKFKCTLVDRSFTAAAPKIWNGLPDYIKKENDFDMFKRLIKTHYFKEANSDLS